MTEVRTGRGITTRDLARQLDKPEDEVLAWEAARDVPDLIDLRRFCVVCGMALEEFIRRLEHVLEE